uniref:Integrator complex subunit 3 homolog n=1 Tax=Cacopsylla melanoneura TaxID=428564 RepID=A0A8D8TAY7_9HEMI
MDSKLSSSKIFTSSCIEVKKDEIDEKYEKCHSILQKMIHGLSDKECNDILNSTMCKDKQHEEIVTLGLLTSILTEPLIAAKLCNLVGLRMLMKFQGPTINRSCS